MIFDTVRLKGPTTTSPFFDFPLIGAQPTDPYIVKEIDGLGPSEVSVNIKRTLNRGGIPQALRPQYKQLEMLIKLNPNHAQSQTPAQLRDALYVLLAPVLDQAITVSLVSQGSVVASIPGYISRITPNPFSKDPEVQVTFPCLQAYFSAPSTVNPAVTGSGTYEIVIPNVIGTAPTPFALDVTLLSTSYTFKMYHKGYSDLDKSFYIPRQTNVNTSIAIGGIPGEKFVRNDTPGQASVNLIGSLGTKSRWLELYPGENRLIFDTNVTVNWLYYTPKYQGV